MDTVQATAELAAVRRRRAELRDVLGSVEEALAAAATGRAVIWGERLHQTLVHLAGEFVEHVEVTEGPDGLHQSILSGDLRLANAVEALTADHVRITAEIGAVVESTEPPVTEADIAIVREQTNAVLGRILGHRQRGADLIYEAFDTDIGGGD